MAYESLRDFIKLLEEKGELKRIKTEVSSDLEISEITSRVNEKHGCALLFENVKGYNIPVLINAFGSDKRMAYAFEEEAIEVVAGRIESLLKSEMPITLWDKVRSILKLKEIAHLNPKIVNSGECKEVIIKDNPSLDIFPIIKCWPLDAGKFITLPMVHTKDPDTGIRNAGMYRLQVFDNKSLGMHWHLHKHGAKHYRRCTELGKKLEVAISLGSDPATTYAASAPLPEKVDELILAGFLRRKSVELVKCETVDLEVPANSEIVLEGYVNPGETRLEGPFGDHTGYYSLPDQYPVFHLTCITHRKNPIYPTTVTGKPPREDCYMGRASQKIFFPLLKMTLPELVDMDLPVEGVFHNLAVVSIDKQYPTHAKKVMHALWGLGQMMFTKIIIVLDKEANVHDLSEVIWRVGNNIDPKYDIEFVQGPIDALDHASRTKYISTKMGIDATRKMKEEGFDREWPERIKMSQGIIDLVNKKWKDYGI
ncbi:menaquinone biosynthesis decarboxylase [Candidatus Poribacteria bacterium]|nr:menaquinone biosynthesis decarboxylase [Candidatus Poribacteria bacterium]